MHSGKSKWGQQEVFNQGFWFVFNLGVEVCRKCFHETSENEQANNMHTHNNETSNE